MIDTLFEGSTEKLVQALLGNEALSEDELDRISALVAKARKDGSR